MRALAARLAGVVHKVQRATGTLTSVDWSMSEPVILDKPKKLVPAFTCTGAGSNPGPDANSDITLPQQAGSCAYIYQWRSLPDRTAGKRTWQVTARSNWTVTWSANTGVSGTLTLHNTATTALNINEWRSELVVGPTR